MKATLTDEELLARVATDRDHEAFRQLFERHSKAAYSLARYLARDDARAEDAVQEAMLRVWLKAGQFDPARGAARTWILRVVANKTLGAMRNLRGEKSQAITELDDARCAGRARAAAETQAEERELAAALRAKMNELPVALRQMMALYYVCEMKQSEIAESLAMPQSTVSLRIREGLAELRKRLEVAGFAAAVPMLGSETIGAALLDGQEVPRGMARKILANIDRAAAHSARAATAGGNGVALWAGAVLVLAAAAGGWWMLTNRQPATPSALSSSGEQASSEPEASGLAESKKSRFSRTWDFNTPEPPQGLRVVEGKWHHVPDGGPDGSGCMETDTYIFSAVLEVPENIRNFRVDVKQKMQPWPGKSGASFSSSVLWYRYRQVGLFRNVGRAAGYRPGKANEAWFDGRWYVTESHIDRWINKQRVAILAIERTSDSRLRLSFRSGPHRMAIDELTIAEITPQEVPDVSRYLEALAKIPGSQRAGTVAVPGLEGEDPTRPVTVEFGGPSDDSLKE